MTVADNRIGQRVIHTEYMFCTRCGETTAFPPGIRTADGLSEVRTCDNDCGQQITTPLLVWTGDAGAEVQFEG